VQRVGTVTSPLHTGHCPPWLFERMKRLGIAILDAIVLEYGSDEAVRRLADPLWFQSFGCVLGFDWHSSGLTTVVLAAIKDALRGRSTDVELFVAGGKGRTARQTPAEIRDAGERHALANDLARLEQYSRLAAKVDSAAVQDGYQLYHHVFIFDKGGRWAVIQQGMNEASRTARRYHWLGENVKKFTVEPHHGIVGRQEPHVLDLTARVNEAVQNASMDLLNMGPDHITVVLRAMREGRATHVSLPTQHAIPRPERIDRVLHEAYERSPTSYEALLAIPGVGSATLRALAMVAEVVVGTPITYVDPVRYSFAHGGKDGHPFPVSTRDYDHSIAVLERAIRKARVGEREKLSALRALAERARAMR
jgi:hypothetical protein